MQRSGASSHQNITEEKEKNPKTFSRGLAKHTKYLRLFICINLKCVLSHPDAGADVYSQCLISGLLFFHDAK